MDPLSAVSLASNILQFIDFAQRLFRETVNLHKGTANDERTELAFVTNGLSKLLSQLESQHQSPQGAVHEPRAQNELSAIAGQCQSVGQELAAALERLNKTTGEKGIRRLAISFQQALKIIWSKDRIEVLKRRLEDLRDHAQFALIMVIRYGHGQSYYSMPSNRLKLGHRSKPRETSRRAKITQRSFCDVKGTRSTKRRSFYQT